MKNHLLFFVTFTILLLSTSNLQAQTKIGLRAGLNFASLQGLDIDNTANIESFPRLTVMIPVEIPLSGIWALQPELGFTQKGLKVGIEDGNNSANVTYQLNYLDINLLGKLTVDAPTIQWGLLAGPSFNYGTSAKLLSVTNINGNTQKEEEKLTFGKEGLRQFDLGIQIGAFLQLPMPSASVFIDTRYHLGLMSINTASDADADPITNRGLHLTAGFLIPIHK